MANKRTSLGDKLRFEIFKRDSFTCQYCGNQPPNVVLWVDHIQPVSKGGSDESINLVTSCKECNRGKGDRKLSALPPSVDDIISEQAETIAQLTAYNDFLRRIHAIEREATDDLVSYFEETSGYELNKEDAASIKTAW